MSPRKPRQHFNGSATSDGLIPDRWPTMLALALLVTFICCRGSYHLSHPEFAMLDQWFRSRPPRPISTDIVLIGIEASDRSELARLKRQSGYEKCTCMLTARDGLGQAIASIKRAGTAVVGIDLIFELPCPVEGHDRTLYEALRMPGSETVIMSETYPEPGKFNFRQMPGFLPDNVIVASPVLYNPRGVVRGVRLIQRDQPEKEQIGDHEELVLSNTRPPFAMACYGAFRGRPEELPEDVSGSLVRCADSYIPVWMSESVCLLGPLMPQPEREAQSAHAMLINWAGRAGTFPAYRFSTLKYLTDAQRREALTGKIVLIGAMDDRQRTPIQDVYHALVVPPSAAHTFPDTVPVPTRGPDGITKPEPTPTLIDQAQETDLTGLEVHANALDTVLQGRFIGIPPCALMWALIMGLSVLALMSFRRASAWQAVLFGAAEIMGVFVLARLLINSDYWLFAVTPAAAIIISSITGAAVAYGEARQQAGQLAKSLEARDNVTATLVHDLKQPLTAINALAQVLRAEEARGGGRLTPEVIERIQNQVRSALGDIDELLSTDPHRVLHLDNKRFDLAALARDLAVTQSMKTGIHTVEVRAPQDGMWVTGDARYLGRALSNLMDNAIKYWPDGGTVVVKMRREPGRINIRVVDHGLGVPKEAQARLFDRFQRAVPEGMNIPGTGIGLFSVRRIVEAHGGTVELISAPGEGSIFIINLPGESVSMPVEGLSQT
jgi:signal transduction histidine kinase